MRALSGPGEMRGAMPPAAPRRKRSPLLYLFVRPSKRSNRRVAAMMGLALGMFIALFAFGNQFMGWHDPHGQVQMGLFMSFLFGIVCGFRTRG